MKKIRYGVFLVGGAWRFYREDRGVSRYNNRPDAISAAKSAARAAIDAGQEVELYFQDIAGVLKRADPATIAH